MEKRKWWKEGIVYQIYPRSFNDSNGDGIGDLQGITNKLNYLKNLGIDIIWLCPVYESPNADNGYDISNYRGIMDEFGTLEDMDELIKEVHNRDMKLVMDLVVNHTSDEHPWFIESQSSRDNQYRDYYIWRDDKNGEPPNNWGSFFRGSTWTYDEKTDQYYLHLFDEKQPDLNWKNPKMRNNIYKMMDWWLGTKGIDGFRMDVINMISKEEGLPDGEVKPGEKYGDGTPHFVNGPRVHEYLQEMNERVLSNYDIMTVGETFQVPAEMAPKYVNEDRNELNMIFNFEIMTIDHKQGNKWNKRDWKLTEIKESIYNWYRSLEEKGWNSIFFNNHDFPRAISKFGNDDQYRVESAKMFATLLLTLPGTPYIYQGEEIGMTNVKFPTIEDYQDVETNNYYREKRKEGIPEAEIMEAIYKSSRDNARTPIQWNDSKYAGFSVAEPWLKVNPNYVDINVKKEKGDPDSILNYYKDLIKIRKNNFALIYGDYQPLLPDDETIFSYLRSYEGKMFLIITNFFEEETTFNLPENITFKEKTLVKSNYRVEDGEALSKLRLRPYEARIYQIK